MTVGLDIDGLQAKAKEKVAEEYTESFIRTSLRHKRSMERLEESYLNLLAAYQVGFHFISEGMTCTILEVQMSYEFDWRNRQFNCASPDFNPDYAISYLIEEVSKRFPDPSKYIWLQVAVKLQMQGITPGFSKRKG